MSKNGAYDEALLHQSLSKQWGFTLEELKISSGVPYFWDDRIGYIATESRSQSNGIYAVQSDIIHINYLKDKIKD